MLETRLSELKSNPIYQTATFEVYEISLKFLTLLGPQCLRCLETRTTT
jgi:hypothetical protein